MNETGRILQPVMIYKVINHLIRSDIFRDTFLSQFNLLIVFFLDCNKILRKKNIVRIFCV